MPINFRTIRADEIDLRVGSTKKENGKTIGFQLLLYKDARVDMAILDSTVSCENWQCRYYQIKETMVCSVGINVNFQDPNKEPLWIWKDDGGDDDFNAEKVKAELSDSFKRACFRWFGRELYNSPFVWINVDSENTEKSHYSVKEIEYKNRVVTKLVIINDKTKKVVYSYGSSEKVAVSSQKEPKKAIAISDEEHESNQAYINTYYCNLPMQRKSGFTNWLFNAYEVESFDELFEDRDKTKKAADYLRSRDK